MTQRHYFFVRFCKHLFAFCGFSYGFAVFLGGFAGLALEGFGEMLYVHNAAVDTYGLYLHIGGGEQVDGVLYPLFSDVFGNGFSGFLSEYGG